MKGHEIVNSKRKQREIDPNLVEAVKYVFHGHVVKETPRLAAKGDTMAVFQLANLHVLANAYVFLS